MNIVRSMPKRRGLSSSASGALPPVKQFYGLEGNFLSEKHPGARSELTGAPLTLTPSLSSRPGIRRQPSPTLESGITSAPGEKARWARP
jgi:hypothetical protein